MHYICQDCSNEFNVYPPLHPHIGPYYSLNGCPVCKAQQAMKKKCPKCGSENLIQTINNNTNNK